VGCTRHSGANRHILSSCGSRLGTNEDADSDCDVHGHGDPDAGCDINSILDTNSHSFGELDTRKPAIEHRDLDAWAYGDFAPKPVAYRLSYTIT